MEPPVPKMKHFSAVFLLASLLAGCFGQNLKPPQGVPNITPKSGPWQVTIDGHPEASGTFQFNFLTNQSPPLLKITTATGKNSQAPIKWTSGNFDIYINYPSDNGYELTEELSMAIQSETQMTGVYSYNIGGSVPALTGGTLGAPTTNSEPSYQANFTAVYGTPAPTASPSAAPAASGAASPAPTASPAASGSPSTTPTPAPSPSAH